MLMKIKIGDKVYLQKYEVLRLIKDDITVPGCMAHEYIGDEGYLEVHSEKDEYDFACCFKADGSVEIIDYKFGTPESAHRRQVERYKALYAGMGYGPVKGFLWYFQENPDGKIAEV